MARWAFLLLLALPACAVEQSADALARAGAKAYINSTVRANFPGVNPEPITNCIVDNATTAEAITIAQAAAMGGTLGAAENIIAIAGRPETTACIASQSLVGILG